MFFLLAYFLKVVGKDVGIATSTKVWRWESLDESEMWCHTTFGEASKRTISVYLEVEPIGKSKFRNSPFLGKEYLLQ